MCKLASALCVILFFILPLFADISVTPYGAAETVSGSCFLLDTGDEKIIVDCGLFMFSSGEQGIDPFTFEESLNLKIQKELIDAKALFFNTCSFRP